jgi:hypothetical protein
MWFAVCLFIVCISYVATVEIVYNHKLKMAKLELEKLEKNL